MRTPERLPVMLLMRMMALTAGFLMALPDAWAEAERAVAISSRASSDYHRPADAKGGLQPQSYVFGRGGMLGGEMHDASTASLTFLHVAHTLAPSLADLGYVPGLQPQNTQLLIMVYWGTTRVAERINESLSVATVMHADQDARAVMGQVISAGAQRASVGTGAPVTGGVLGAADSAAESAFTMAMAEAAIKDRVDRRNAAILGFDSAVSATDGLPGTAGPVRRGDVLAELEEERYFVVLMAYDWRLLSRTRMVKLLWETRFSIRSMGNGFDEQLGPMVHDASSFFGRDSHGLVHRVIPEGRVIVGAPRPVR